MNSLDRSKGNRLVLSATLLPTAFQPIQPASGRINCKKFVASWAEGDECNKRERERRASRAPARKRIRAEMWILKKRVASFRGLTWLTRGCKRIIRTFLEIRVDASFAITLYVAKDLTFRRKKLYREMLKQTRRCLNERNIANKMFRVFMRNFQLNLRRIYVDMYQMQELKHTLRCLMGEGNFCSAFIFRINLDFHERTYNSHEQCYMLWIFCTRVACIVCSFESLNFPQMQTFVVH